MNLEARLREKLAEPIQLANGERRCVLDPDEGLALLRRLSELEQGRATVEEKLVFYERVNERRVHPSAMCADIIGDVRAALSEVGGQDEA